MKTPARTQIPPKERPLSSRRLGPASVGAVCATILASFGCAGTPRAVDEALSAPSPEEPMKVATHEVPEEERWRAAMPPPGEPPDIAVPSFERRRLDNGMRVIVSARSDLPLVSFNVAFLAGSSSDPAGLAGLATLTYGLLLEGAGGRDAMELADAFAELGTSPYVSVDEDGALVGVRVLSRNAGPALELLADVVRAPSLSIADFERRKNQRLADLARSMGEPRWLANEALSAVIFGEEHPYGRPSSGTPWSMIGLTHDDVRAFHERAVGPGSAAFVVTGDIDMDRAMALAEAHFGDWDRETARPADPAAPDVLEREEVFFIEQPGMQQTLLMLGRPGLAVGHEDELPLLLAGQIFGGMFGSRLNLNLREDKGYTYRAFSRVSTQRGAGRVTAGSSVHSEHTGAALEEVFDELRGLRERPISEDELASAREGLIRAIPGWFETIEALARTGAALFWRDLPMDRYEQLIAGLEAVSLESVQRAAERYFDPATMQLVLVGDPDTLEEQVPPLKLGDMVRRSPGGPPAE